MGVEYSVRNWGIGRECNRARGVHTVVLLGENHSNGNSRWWYKYRSSWVEKQNKWEELVLFKVLVALKQEIKNLTVFCFCEDQVHLGFN